MGPSSPSSKRGQSPPIFGPCVLWPNGWMDQDGTWLGGGPWSRPHCTRWVSSSPPHKRDGAPAQFSAYFYCVQTAGCIKMVLGMEVGLGPGHIVLDGDTAPSPQKGTEPQFLPISIVTKLLDASRCHLAWRWASAQATLC